MTSWPRRKARSPRSAGSPADVLQPSPTRCGQSASRARRHYGQPPNADSGVTHRGVRPHAGRQRRTRRLESGRSCTGCTQQPWFLLSRCCGRRSAHRLLHQRGDLCLVGGGQLRQREGGRPHGAFVEVCLVAEAERRVPRLELLRALEVADDLAVLGIRTSLSPSTFAARRPRRAAAFSSWERAFIAARSSSVNPLDFCSLLSAIAKYLRASGHVVGEADPSSCQRPRLEKLEPMSPIHVLEQCLALSKNKRVDGQP